MHTLMKERSYAKADRLTVQSHRKGHIQVKVCSYTSTYAIVSSQSDSKCIREAEASKA